MITITSRLEMVILAGIMRCIYWSSGSNSIRFSSIVAMTVSTVMIVAAVASVVIMRCASMGGSSVVGASIAAAVVTVIVASRARYCLRQLLILRRRSVTLNALLAGLLSLLSQVVEDVDGCDGVVDGDLADELATLTIRDAQRLVGAVPLVSEVLLAGHELALTIVVLVADDAGHLVQAPYSANDL